MQFHKTEVLQCQTRPSELRGITCFCQTLTHFMSLVQHYFSMHQWNLTLRFNESSKAKRGDKQHNNVINNEIKMSKFQLLNIN